MKRIIVDYKKLTNEILKLISERYPDGYTDSDIIVFRNKDNEIIEAIEIKTEDTVYLVKVGKKLADSLEVFLSNEDDEDDLDAVVGVGKDINDADLGIDDAEDDEDESDNVTEDYDDEDDEEDED